MTLQPLAALAVVLGLWAGPALAEPADCDGLPFRAAAELDAAWVCAPLDSREVGADGRTFTLRAVRDAALPAGVVDQHAARALDAMETAWQGYAALAGEFGFRFGHVTLVVPDPARVATEPHGSLDGSFGDANAFTFSEECVVRLNVPMVDGQGLGQIDATAAHELAHCVQGWTYGSAIWTKRHRWWTESTAVLLQDMVLPEQAVAAAWAGEFVASIEGNPLTRQPYAGAVFFAWLAQTHRDRLPGLLRDLAAGAGEAEHQATLHAAVGDEGFREFAHALVDGTVAMPSGFAVPPVPGEPAATAVAAEEGAISLPALPFTLVRQRLDVTGGTYRAAGPAGALRLRPAEGGAWFDANAQPFGPEDCGDERRFLLAEMPSDPAADSVEATTTRATACAGCAAPRTVDACLIGTWVVSNQALADLAQFNQNAGGGGTGATVTDVSGTVALSLLASGEGQWVIESLSIDMSLPLPQIGGNAVIDIGGDGIIDGRWGAGDGVMDWCFAAADTDLTVQVDLPGGVSTTDDWGAPPFEDSSYVFACSGDALRLTYAGPESRPVRTEWLLTRR